MRFTARLLCLVAALNTTLLFAAESADKPAAVLDTPEISYKLTTSWYHLSDKTDGVDINLRQTSVLGDIWLGYFDLHKQSFGQWRGGWDNTFGQTLRITPSFQLADHGFIGGSIQFETGNPWFAGVGFGRTNLKPYWNLNFDPNDSFMLSAGHRSERNQLFMFQLVRDNRQNPDQRHLHFVYRQPLQNGERLTLDTLYKTGLVEDVMIHRWGLTATYDWPKFFVRLAIDPKTNFTTADSTRLSIGTRF